MRCNSSGTGGREALDGLVGRDDDDKALGCGGHDLLPGQRSSAALHEPAVSRHLVGAVDREVEPIERVERLYVEPEIACCVLGGGRRRHAPDGEATRDQRGQEVRDRRARAQTDCHPGFHQLGRGVGSQALFVVRGHRGTVSG